MQKCVSVRHKWKRYQYRDGISQVYNFSLRFSFIFEDDFVWVHCEFASLKSFSYIVRSVAKANQWIVATKKKHQHNRIDWNLIFNILFANFFSHVKMKVNICLRLDSDWMQFLELFARDYRYFFLRINYMWAGLECRTVSMLKLINGCQSE